MEKTLEQPALLENKKQRFWELDFLRGLCVILMVFDHVMYSVGYAMPKVGSMLGKTLWDNATNFVTNMYWDNPVRTYIRFVVLFFFFSICGISCTFSRSNIKRGAMCFFVGCVITFATVLVDKIALLGVSIYFGVLHMLGISMMLYGVIDKLAGLIVKAGRTDKQKSILKTISGYVVPTIGLILLIIFFACYYSGLEYDTFGTNVFIEDTTVSTIASLFINVVPHKGNISGTIGGSDYWPLLPWMAIVFIGGFIGRGVYKTKAKNYLVKLDGKWNKPVCFVGRHALLVYALHQVVVVALLILITLIA